jgi:hypothetical protein
VAVAVALDFGMLFAACLCCERWLCVLRVDEEWPELMEDEPLLAAMVAVVVLFWCAEELLDVEC